ncbi:MAG: hypothetical protein ACLFMM_02655 [Methanohalobium sp.]|uniref:hypothetical protein n=1 Tax=Methanohalobium sp. TaxID=2837493 RepID=UPI0039792274
MDGIFSLMLLVIGILFAVLMVWVWRNNDLTTLKKSILSLLLVVISIVSVYGSFAYVLISSDHAYYTTDGKNLGDVDHEEIVNNSRQAGYTIKGPYFVNAEIEKAKGLYAPSDELKSRFGQDYWVAGIGNYYTEESFFESEFIRDEKGTRITFFNESRPDSYFSSFKVEHLPDDEWITDQFELMFSLDSAQSQKYLNQLKDEIRTSNQSIVVITIEQYPDFNAVYHEYQNRSKNSTSTVSRGEGWITQTFYRNGNITTGTIVYVVPNMELINYHEGDKYTIKMDRMGGIRLQIELDVGEQIPEEEYKQIFKQMFGRLGLPPQRIEDFEFDYQPSVW